MTAFDALADLLSRRRVCVLTGAGCSTESGIPDYRGPETSRRARNPIRFDQFVKDPAWRHRYWARSTVGWPRIRDARPNAAHQALASLEDAGLITGLITQNVDRLHHRAGSTNVIELHGTLSQVVCLDCGQLEDREALQGRLEAANPGWTTRHAHNETAPDGDVELSEAAFCSVDCLRCGGPLKPDVVFFGENVPRQRVARAREALAAADVLLVVGSSLTVFSGFRFVRYAEQAGQPIGIVNMGPTRGDALARVRVDRPAGTVLPALVEVLSRAAAAG